MSGPLESVAVIGNPWYRHFFADLGVLLKERHGAALHVYSVSEAGCELYRGSVRDGVFASFSVMPSPATYVPGQVLDEKSVTARARSFERKYGVTYNSLMVPDRLFGRGYAPGGYHHPRSLQSERGTMVDALHIYNQQFEFWEGEFETKGIGMVLEVTSPLIAAVARHHGALVRSPTSSRHRNLYYWTNDEFGYCEAVAQIYASSREVQAQELAGAPLQGRMFNAEARRRFGLPGVVRAVAGHTREQIIWRLRGYQKAYLYLYRDQVALAWRRRRDYRKVTGRHTTRLADLKGRPFVFYGLHVEPEIWFQGRSPEFFYQLSAIISLSRDLPAGVLLAVKEHHPAVGRRPDGFYEQIRELKNVVLVDIEEPGQEVARQAAAVATICGTIGQEAAAMGKPVIAFGRHNLYNILDHVRLVTQEEQLKPALEWALGLREDGAAQKAGRRFLGAVVAASFDMKGFTPRTLRGYDGESIEQACERLEESIAPRLRDSPAAAESPHRG